MLAVCGYGSVGGGNPKLDFAELIRNQRWRTEPPCNWNNVAGLSQLTTESIATIPPFGPIEGNKWFDQISSQ
jgi:hypothetical protein